MLSTFVLERWRDGKLISKIVDTNKVCQEGLNHVSTIKHDPSLKTTTWPKKEES
jgi:hypothetical protein